MTRRTQCLPLLLLWLMLCLAPDTNGQLVVNEGSNRNFSVFPDEDNEYGDWIELYHPGTDSLNLLGYTLSDDPAHPSKWTFPAVKLPPGAFKPVFCSGKDRKPVGGFQQVLNTGTYTPVIGWNTHTFSRPFLWDGLSNLVINLCSYDDRYTVSSVVRQSSTSYNSTLCNFVDNSADACGFLNGQVYRQRPNLKLNGYTIGTGTLTNSPYDYPAPYGNWYWSARHQFLIPAAELLAAGLTAGPLNSLSFDVVETDPNTEYEYIDIQMKMVTLGELNSQFFSLNTNQYLHTNFTLGSGGETVYLFAPDGRLLSQLKVDCINPNDSRGWRTDGGSAAVYFSSPTPAASNGSGLGFSGYLQQPLFSRTSGIYASGLSVTLQNPNVMPSRIRYTLDGSIPTESSTLYQGTPILVNTSKVLTARAFADTLLPSPTKAASYLVGINHTTPVLSVITAEENLYGPTGIFENWSRDWERPAFAEFFRKDKSLVFSQTAGMQVDGGAGGSRSNPQHSFRLELDNGALGGGSVLYPLIPDKPARTRYSRIYLRNGSNQFLRFPYKDAAGVKALCDESLNYYSACTPVSVYINGAYFGLYELREKFDEEYFQQADGADSTDLLSLSYWYGSILRALSGSVDSFYAARDTFNTLDPAAPDYWTRADRLFDLTWYTDYIIAESFIHNTDWPQNNIKIYRSEKTGWKYRFCVIDVELALQPHGWSSSNDDPIQYLLGQPTSNPFIHIWLKSIQHPAYRRYFINRYADLLNTAYLPQRLSDKETALYQQWLPEMPKEYARWGDPNAIPQQMAEFTDNHNTYNSELRNRGARVRPFIQSGFGLNGQVPVTLNTLPARAGKIKISTITPESLPWTGIYFNGNPVTLVAEAAPGYEFSHWDTNAVLNRPDSSVDITVNVTRATRFTAVFRKQASPEPDFPVTPSPLLVFPNPSRGDAQLFFQNQPPGSYQLRILDAQGRTVGRRSLNLTQPKVLLPLPAGTLSQGTYFIHIHGPAGVKTLRWVLTR